MPLRGRSPQRRLRELPQHAPDRLRNKTRTNNDWGRMLFRRDAHFAEVLEREVLARHRRAFPANPSSTMPD